MRLNTMVIKVFFSFFWNPRARDLHRCLHQPAEHLPHPGPGRDWLDHLRTLKMTDSHVPLKSKRRSSSPWQQCSANPLTGVSLPNTDQSQCCLTFVIVRELAFPSWWATLPSQSQYACKLTTWKQIAHSTIQLLHLLQTQFYDAVKINDLNQKIREVL